MMKLNQLIYPILETILKPPISSVVSLLASLEKRYRVRFHR